MAVSRDIANDKVPETSSQISSPFSFPEPQQETFPKNIPPPNSQQLDITMVSSPKCDRNVLFNHIIMLIHQN